MAKKKNKQVKQMMKDIEKTEYLPTPDGNSGYDVSNLTGIKSLTAMDHWLFLSNHKIEKESWQVTIK